MEAFGILLRAGIAWLWLDSLKAREAAIRAAREVCAAEGLLLLDDTVGPSGSDQRNPLIFCDSLVGEGA